MLAKFWSVFFQRILPILSLGLLLVGILTASAFCFYNQWEDFSTQQAAVAQGSHFWTTPVMPTEERKVGVIFGLGIAFLGMFGLSVSVSRRAVIRK